MNTFQITIFFLAVLLMVGFIAASLIKAILRKTFDSWSEVLWSMVTDGIFLGALVGGLYMWYQGSYTEMILVFAGFIGYKAVVTEAVIIKNGDYKYLFFDNDKLNKWSSYFISTKTLMVLLGIGIIWGAGYYGKFEAALVSDQIMILAGAWLGANGLSAITVMAKGKDLSFLNPTQRPKPIPNQPVYIPGTATIVPEIEAPPTQIAAPVGPVIPPYEDFDEDTWNKAVTPIAFKQDFQDTPVTHYRAIIAYASTVFCYYMANLISYVSYRLSWAEKQFVAVLGFTYEDRNLPENLRTLYDYCGKSPKSFEDYMSFASEYGWSSHEEVWADLIRMQEVSVLATRAITKKAYLDSKLQAYTTYKDQVVFNPFTYTQAFGALVTDWKKLIT